MVFSVATGSEPCESQTCMDRLIPHSWFVLQTELGNVRFISLKLKIWLKDDRIVFLWNRLTNLKDLSWIL
jgi:hypothetical protein